MKKTFKHKLFVILVLITFLIPQFSFAAIDITTLTYDNKSKSVNSEDPQPYGLFFKSDGTVMYMGGYSGCFVFQYSLSTAWDVSSASYGGLNVDTYTPTGDCSTPSDIYIKSDGTKIYVASAGRKVYQFTMSTPWNISTATYDNKYISTIAQESLWFDAIYFKSDGTKMYGGGNGTDRIFQYTLSTPWDISTATYDSVSFLITGQTANSVAFSINADGTKGFIFGGVPSRYVYQYSFGTPWDLSTITSDGLGASYNFAAQLNNVQAAFMNADASKLYVATEETDDIVFQYSFPDATNPTVSTLSPADNATSISTTANLVITFDEAVDPEAGADNDIVIKKTSDNSTIETIDAQDAKVTGGGTTTITVNPAATLSEQTGYYVQIGADAFDDAASNSYAGISNTTSWNFTTGDFTNPTVSTLSPLDNAINVAIDSNLVLTFDEIVDAETGNIVIKKTSDNSTVETIAVGSTTGTGTTIITINPTADLANSTEYYVTIDATAFDDVNSNSYAGISSSTTWSFTTVATPARGSSGSKPKPKQTVFSDAISTIPNFVFPDTLVKLWTRGENCKTWQSFFNTKGANLITDGICGPITISFAKTWQASVGLKADGLLGPLSRAVAGR